MSFAARFNCLPQTIICAGVLLLAAPAGCGSKYSVAGNSNDAAVSGDASGLADAVVQNDAEIFGMCGDGMLDPNEQCDDGNQSDDDLCLTDCTFACGDGVVNAVEQCDTAIAAGQPGACPTDCDDSDTCTTDSLVGGECQAECVFGDISGCTNGDGCCPTGCNQGNDDDCGALCGNAIIETNETCDPPASCPTDCDDTNACTVDVLSGDAATCDAACSNTPISGCTNGDGCCPTGCNATNDTDCSANCGNAIVETGETCDPPGDCPTDCDDTDSCTADQMTGSAANCNVVCSNTTIVSCANGDGCCPAGCHNNNDTDCSPVCGNTVVETGEGCDDGNLTDGDGCDAGCQVELVPTVFRLSDLDLRDPHVYVQVLWWCNDITDTPVGGFAVNSELETAITTDDDADGDLDLSFLIIMRPLDQSVPGGSPADVTTADCSDPMASTVCTANATEFQSTTYTNGDSGNCLGVLPNTTDGYSPGITLPGPVCFSTAPFVLTLNMGGIQIPLTNVQVGATYVGSPAAQLNNGLMRGFISEADADTTILPADLPLVGGEALSSMLPGGTGCCQGGTLDTNNGVPGWWFYLNFPAHTVTYVGP